MLELISTHRNEITATFIVVWLCASSFYLGASWKEYRLGQKKQDAALKPSSLAEQLEQQKAHFFGEKNDCAEALNSAKAMFPGKAQSVTVGIGIYHNTLLEQLKRELQP